MGIAGHQHFLIAFALHNQHMKKLLNSLGNVFQLSTGEEFQVEQHLVVARTATVNLLAYIAKLTRQHKLNLRMNVFDAFFYHKLATLGRCVNILQLGQQQCQFIFCQQTYGLKHGDVGHGAQHVILGQIKVHLTVASHGETLYILVYLNGFLPKFLSHVSINI